MGTDCVKPFIDDCKKYGKGIFILVKTSNPSSGELQDLKLQSGEKIYEENMDIVVLQQLLEQHILNNYLK